MSPAPGARLLTLLCLVSAVAAAGDAAISTRPHRPQPVHHGEGAAIVMTADAAAAGGGVDNAAGIAVATTTTGGPPKAGDDATTNTVATIVAAAAAKAAKAAAATAAAEAADAAAKVAASDAVATAAAATQVASIPWSRFRAVTVVHEPCSTLDFTLTNFAGNLGPDWPILVIYTPRAKDAVLDNKTVRYLSRYGALHTLPLSALAIPGLDELTHVAKYSLLLARPEFWQAVHAEKALVFQVDSVLCSASPWTIDDFLAYDYVGAPWVHADHIVGNGGLSLRSVDKMLAVTRQSHRNPHPEDVYFVEGLAALAEGDVTAVVRAPRSVAERFAFEMDAPPSAVPFGVHRSIIVPADTKAAIVAGCPEAAAGVWTSCGRGNG